MRSFKSRVEALHRRGDVHLSIMRSGTVVATHYSCNGLQPNATRSDKRQSADASPLDAITRALTKLSEEVESRE